MAGDAPIVASAVGTVPVDYQVPGSQEILLKSVSAIYDGSGSAAAWFPCLEILSPAGTIMVSAVSAQSVAAGASADASWFRGVSEAVLPTTIVTLGVLAERPVGNPQSITSDFNFHAISFSDVVFDTNGMWDAGTPDRITCKVAGTYFVAVEGGFVTNGTGDRGVKILLNGVTQLSINEGPAGASFFWAGTCGAAISLAVGDYLQTQVAQNSGGNLNTGYCNITAFAVGASPI